MKQLPIKKSTKIGQKPFIDLVNKILEITKSDNYLENTVKQAKVKEYEKQIDQLVYKLYGLTSEEIKIVENGK
jgi:adenine-specific DNA-methyltransferase